MSEFLPYERMTDAAIRRESEAFRALLSVVAGQVEVNVPIRGDLTVSMRVPRDLTREEATHISLVLFATVKEPVRSSDFAEPTP